MPKEDETVADEDYNKPIDVIKSPDDIDAEPLPIPPGFYWENVNIENDQEADEVYQLLT